MKIKELQNILSQLLKMRLVSFTATAPVWLLLSILALMPTHRTGVDGLATDASEEQCFQLAWDLAAATPKTVR